jgi:hypothetical protein
VANFGGLRVEFDEAEYDRIVRSPAGPVAKYIYGLAQRITQVAKRRAPVGKNSKTPEGHPAGWLRSQQEWSGGVDGEGVYADLGNPALTSRANPFPDEAYGEHIEFPSTRPRKPPPFARGDQPYTIPAVLEVFAQEGA